MILTVAATAGTKTKNIMNNDLQRVNNRIRQLKNTKMYEVEISKLKLKLNKAINDADAASRGYNINNDRL